MVIFQRDKVKEEKQNTHETNTKIKKKSSEVRPDSTSIVVIYVSAVTLSHLFLGVTLYMKSINFSTWKDTENSVISGFQQIYHTRLSLLVYIHLGNLPCAGQILAICKLEVSGQFINMLFDRCLTILRKFISDRNATQVLSFILEYAMKKHRYVPHVENIYSR